MWLTMTQSPAPTPESAQEVDERPAAAGLSRLRWYVVALLAAVLFVPGWLVFSWALHGRDDPEALLRELRYSPANWQSAYSLARLLRDPGQGALRRDSSFCRALATILDDQLGSGGPDRSQLQFQVFLCRALGEFEVPDGLAALLRAVESGPVAGQIDVRCAALEAIAVLADGVRPEVLRRQPRLMPVLLDASRAGDSTGARDPGRVAATAAFALGVLGGRDAQERLRQMLDDRRPDVRYNAATGLARQGDAAAMPVLVEMLGTDMESSQEAVSDPGAAAHRRQLVWTNALRAVQRLASSGMAADARLLETLKRLQHAPNLPAHLRSAVEAVQADLRAAAVGGNNSGQGGL